MGFRHHRQDILHKAAYADEDDATLAVFTSSNYSRNTSFANGYESHRRGQTALRQQVLGVKQDNTMTAEAVPHGRRQSEPIPAVDTKHAATAAFAAAEDQADAKDNSRVMEQPNTADQQAHKFVPSAEGLWSWIPHLVQSADDSTVSSRVREVFVFADQFVNNFYSDRHYEGSIPDQTLALVNSSQLLETHQLQIYLAQAAYQLPLIKHTLTSMLLNLISFDSVASNGSLLPREFRSFNILAKARTTSKSTVDGVLNIQPALSAYRVLSAYIRSDVEHDPNYLEERQHVIGEVIKTFEQAFQYWVDVERSEADRRAALRQVLNTASSTGIFLFSQPAVFFFDWEMTPKDQSARRIPTSPRLLRVFDNDAQFKDMADHMIPMKCASIFSETGLRQGRPHNTTKDSADISHTERLANKTPSHRQTTTSQGADAWKPVLAMPVVWNENAVLTQYPAQAQNVRGAHNLSDGNTVALSRNPQPATTRSDSSIAPQQNSSSMDYGRYAPQIVPENLAWSLHNADQPPLRPPKVPHVLGGRR